MMQSAGECDVPFKQAFNDLGSAQRAADGMNARNFRGGKRRNENARKARTYECVAGHWHITGAIMPAVLKKQKVRLRETRKREGEDGY